MCRGHPLSRYVKFSEELTFFIPWYAHARDDREFWLIFAFNVMFYHFEKQSKTFFCCHMKFNSSKQGILKAQLFMVYNGIIMHLKIPASSIFYSKCTTIKSKFSFTKSPHDLILLWRLFGSSVSLQSYTTSSPMPSQRGMGGDRGGKFHFWTNITTYFTLLGTFFIRIGRNLDTEQYDRRLKILSSLNWSYVWVYGISRFPSLLFLIFLRK